MLRRQCSSNEIVIPMGIDGSEAQRKQLRHKSSFVRRLDSSEEPATSNESIFEAEYLSISSEESIQTCINWPTPGPATAPRRNFPLNNISNTLESLSLTTNCDMTPSAIGTTPILYGHGTALATILEQNSKSTIRTSSSVTTYHSLPMPHSISDLRTSIAASAPHLIGREKSIDLKRESSLRRRISLSADDLTVIKRFYHNALCNIESATERPPAPVPFADHEVYASPKKPVLAPLQRPCTPPGYPSWTEAQNAPLWPREPTRAPNRLQKFLGIEPNPIELSRRIPLHIRRASACLLPSSSTSSDLLHTMSVSSAAGQRRAPRFRPPRSMHSTGLEMHPYVRDAATRRMAYKEDRLTPNGVRTVVWGEADVHDGSTNFTTDRSELASSAPLSQLAQRAMLHTMDQSAGQNFECLTAIRDGSRMRTPALNRLEAVEPQQTSSGNAMRPCRHKQSRSIVSQNIASHEPSPVGKPHGQVIARTSDTKEQLHQCWRCRAAGMWNMLDVFWDRGAGCLYWHCCGADVDERVTADV